MHYNEYIIKITYVIFSFDFIVIVVIKKYICYNNKEKNMNKNLNYYIDINENMVILLWR